MRSRLALRLFVTMGVLVFLAVAISIAPFVPAWETLAAGAGSGLFCGFLLSRLAVRWVDEGLKPLADTAQRMHLGDLDVRSGVNAAEDIGKLGAVFDRLAESLSETLRELRSERDLVARILNGMHEGVLLLDKDGRVDVMNPALREMLLLRADAQGQPLLEVVRNAELEELLDSAKRTGTVRSGELELGGIKPRRLLVRATSFSDGGGMLAVFFDVTDVRRLESLRRDFVGNVSHELRTPVTAILSATETLNLALKNPEDAKRFLGIIERNAARLQRLIEDLLDLSRIESRELRLRSEHFVFEPFANHLIGMFRERADKKKVDLALSCEDGLEADGDKRALEQVITNLVDNAVKYCPEGSTVTLHASKGEAGVTLKVADDGPGIAEQHLTRIFERFYRVDAGRSREMGGTGLGLSIVKHLVDAMGGTIDVSSTVGKGTTFEVLLPYPERRSGDVSSPPPPVTLPPAPPAPTPAPADAEPRAS